MQYRIVYQIIMCFITPFYEWVQSMVNNYVVLRGLFTTDVTLLQVFIPL